MTYLRSTPVQDQWWQHSYVGMVDDGEAIDRLELQVTDLLQVVYKDHELLHRQFREPR